MTDGSPDDETATTYETIAGAYRRRQAGVDWHDSWLGALLDRLVAGLPPGATVVDLGCGPGVHVRWLAGRGLAAVGVDRSAAMLAEAADALHRSQPGQPARLVRADLSRLPFADGSVDGVVSSYALLHLPDARLEAAFAEIARVLVPGGLAALTFAGGSGPYREEVPYATGIFRTFHPVTRERAAELAAAAGLVTLDGGADEGASRDAHWLLLQRPPRVTLRVLTPDDWLAWRELRLAALATDAGAFGSRLADWQEAGEERWRARLAVPGSHNLAAYLDGRPAGMASGIPADDGTAELVSMWVAPWARGQRVSDALVTAVVDWAAARGASTVQLDVVVGNDAAVALYRRHAFVDAGPAPDADDGPAEARMVRRLG